MDERTKFVARTAIDRKEREIKKMNEILATKLQALVRGNLARLKFKDKIRLLISEKFASFTDLDKTGKELLKNEDVLKYGRLELQILDMPEDMEMFIQLCRHLILSMDSPKKDTNFATMFLSTTTIAEANRFIGNILQVIPQALMHITGARVSEVKAWQVLIHLMLVFASANGWSMVRTSPQVQHVLNGLCAKMSAQLNEEKNYIRLANSLFIASNEHKPLISLEALNALFSILFKPVRCDDSLLNVFIAKVLTCPAILLNLSKTSTDALLSSKLFDRIITRIRTKPDMIDNIEPNRTINLLGNIIHLGYLDQETLKSRVVDWTWVIGSAMAQCTEFAVRSGEKSSHNHWHPIFGHYRLPIDTKTESSLRNVLRQLQLLWSHRVVSCLFGKALAGLDTSKSNDHETGKELGVTLSKLWKKLGGGISDTSTSIVDLENEAPPTLTAIVCQLYITSLSTMLHLKSEIISGICRDDQLLRNLWAYLLHWGNRHGPQTSSFDPPPMILDEEEMYEKGIPFATSDLISIARFCNLFCFRAVWNGYVDEKSADNGLFSSIHQLCMVLYVRDNRRSFISEAKFWLAPDVKSSVLINEFEKKTVRGILLMRRMSHLVTLKERMLLFRKYVSADKSSIETPATLITVVRNRLVEDGYRQLSLLSTRALKSTIRVKFVNQQGLDEAGIDQDGVFKEFLELTLKQVFDPALNLFHSISAGVLYPSSTSSVHEDHLALFQFVGRMLAKAVYEGIVVDVQLAPVLLAAVLGGRRLCAFDELSQLDPELYRNLTFVKRYDGDIGDLSLTFSIDEDFMGKINTIDLIPGGRTIQVTTENKIDYIHRMAHHRVFSQTKQQCKAFVSGVQSVLNPAWLFLFAPHELQYLISGQTSDIDLSDLKKHVQYYGGFHGSHRLIKWLWDIIENEFTAEERKLFLKFVTSCSRPPLLGFSYLEPPFSIRCVEVSDDQDQGDTLGSVVRGFLALKKSQSVTRLPTASTCFNLLKLPNYNKKSVLLSKLRYAIHSETGFELS